MIYYNYGIKNSRIFKKNGLEKTIQDFKLKSRLYDNKVLLKYDQLVSPTLILQKCKNVVVNP
jgi:hypothetical protein